MASVGVVIPCYNYGHFLSAAVESALSQPGVDVRVIVIDDASTDDSAAVAGRLAAAEPRVEVICHDKNRGHIATYNEGLALVRSDYAVLLSADDLLTPGALTRAAGLMDAHPSVGMVYGHPLAFRDGAPLPAARTGRHSRTVWSGRDWLERMCRAGRNCISSPEVVMRTSVQHRVGGYNPALPHSGDMEMWMRAAAVSDIGRIKGADQAFYRVHGSSMHLTTYNGALFDFQARMAAFRSALGASGLDDAQRLEHLASSSVAILTLRHALRGLRCATTEHDDVEAYMAFARSLSADSVGSAEWRAIERLRVERRSPWSVASARLEQRVRAKLAFRYWRHQGLERPA